MRKLFSILAVALLTLAAHATERIVWAGNKPISYNQDKYIGTTLEIYNLQGLAVGDIIKVYGTPKIAVDVEYVLQYKEGNNWTWTALSTSVENDVCTYEVADAAIAGYIEERGLIVNGQGYDVTKVTIATGNGQKEVWRQESLHIYDTDETHKNSFDTRPNPDQPGLVDFSSLRPGYTLKVYSENPVENPSYQLQYRAGDGWTWTTIASSADVNGVIAYKIESMDIAQEIRDRGLIVNGNGYYINRIGVETATKYALWDGSMSAEGWWWLNGQGYLVSDVSRLAKGDKLILTISGTSGDDRQLKIVNQETEGETPTFGDIYVTTLDNEGAQTVEVTLSESNVNALKSGKGGIIATGTGCTLTKIELQKASQSVEERTVWINHGKQISWNNDYYPGRDFDTYSVLVFGVTAGSIIRAQITVGLSSYSYNVQYKTGDNWNILTDLIAQVNASGTVGSTTEISYTVADAEHAALIAERGLVFRGQGYDINRITIEVPASSLTVSDDADPATKLAQLQALNEPVDITISRTLYRDGYFNTLCLPFDLSAEQIAASELSSAEIMEFTNAYISGEGDEQTLDLRFDPVSQIEAGKPYLIRFPDTDDELSSIAFNSVIVTKDPSDEPITIDGTSMDFVGILAPTHLNSSNNLFLGANDELYWMNENDDTDLKGFRAYFVAPAAARSMVRGKRARIVTRENAPTGLSDVQTTVRGTKVMKDGQLFIIYEGKTYNAQGQTIR